jgi:hypothetical protein
VQTERRLSTCLLSRFGCTARDLSGSLKADRDLDDENCLGQLRREWEQVGGEDTEASRRKKQDVGTDRRDHRRQ